MATHSSMLAGKFHGQRSLAGCSPWGDMTEWLSNNKNRTMCRWWSSLGLSGKKNPPAMQETWVWSLGQEDPLEREMTTHSSILAHQRSLVGCSQCKRVGHNLVTKQQQYVVFSLSLAPTFTSPFLIKCSIFSSSVLIAVSSRLYTGQTSPTKFSCSGPLLS